MKIFSDLNADPVENKLAQRKQKWLNHVNKTEDIRYPKQLLHYLPVGRRPR
jgi:hypothetical protein